MASYIPPQKGVQYVTYVSLVSQANVKIMQVNPTLAAGDVKVSTDSSALSNLDTLPSVDPAGSVFVKVTVSATEMNGDNAKIWFHDAAGAEWCDLTINIPTSGQTLNEIDTLIDTLISRLTAARAGYLDELGPANIPLDIDTLLLRLTAARAALLDQITAARMSELDAANIPLDIDTLLTRLSAARAALLDEITAARMGELDAANIPADIDTLKGYCDILDHATNGLANIKSLIDAVKAVTDLLPDAGALSDLAINKGHLEHATYGLSALKILINALQADLDNPDQYKADVSALALEATLTAIGLVVVAIDARLPADPADQSLLEAHITAEVDDLITRVKGLNAIYDSVALRALEATLTAIKGAGWNAATDTLEKIRDAIIVVADLVYAPDASSVIATGNEIANTYAACAIDNAVRWQIEDTGAGDGLDVICEFNLATTRRAASVHINGYFNGAGGPVEIYVYNYISASWNKLSAGTPGTEMRSRANDRDYVFPLMAGNTDLTTSPGEVKIRFLTESSNAGDDLYLDYVGVVATATILPEVIANAVWEFNVEDIRYLVTGEYTAGHVIKRLVALGTDVAVEDTAISFTLRDGITRDDAYPDMLIEVRDESSATRDIEIRRIISWTAARVVIVDRAFSFTPTVGDHVHITCGYLGISDLALEATLTAIKGAGWTNETLKLVKELVDELESGEKPPRKASFRM